MENKEQELLLAVGDSVIYLLNHLCNGSFWHGADKCTGCNMIGLHLHGCQVKALLDRLIKICR